MALGRGGSGVCGEGGFLRAPPASRSLRLCVPGAIPPSAWVALLTLALACLLPPHLQLPPQLTCLGHAPSSPVLSRPLPPQLSNSWNRRSPPPPIRQKRPALLFCPPPARQSRPLPCSSASPALKPRPPAARRPAPSHLASPPPLAMPLPRFPSGPGKPRLLPLTIGRREDPGGSYWPARLSPRPLGTPPFVEGGGLAGLLWKPPPARQGLKRLLQAGWAGETRRGSGQSGGGGGERAEEGLNHQRLRKKSLQVERMMASPGRRGRDGRGDFPGGGRRRKGEGSPPLRRAWPLARALCRGKRTTAAPSPLCWPLGCQGAAHSLPKAAGLNFGAL